MKRTVAFIALGGLVAGLTVLAPASPASAAVTTTVSGTTVTVTATGDVSFGISCSSSKLTVNGTVTSPAIACSALTSVTVDGDDGDQDVRASSLGPTTYPALVSTTMSMGGGDDYIESSLVPDTIDTGTGDDAVWLFAGGAADPKIALGGSPDDILQVAFNELGDDQVVAQGTGPGGQMTTKTGPAAAVVRPFDGVGTLLMDTRAGNDLMDTSQLATNALTKVDLSSSAGDDTFKSGPVATQMAGRSGTNTYIGGAGADEVYTTSQTDTISLGGGTNEVIDTQVNYGGRKVLGASGSDGYTTTLSGADAVWRIRPTAGGGTKATASLNRSGIALLPASVDRVGVILSRTPDKADQSMADVVTSGADVTVSDTTKQRALVDITITTGGWSSTGTIGNGSGVVDPSDPALGSVTLTNVGPVSVHGPWTDKQRGWAHRATRDLLFRFADASTLDALQAQLAGGTSRASATAAIMGTDEYRGLDVDRVFIDFLRRPADPGGRAYWINSIRNGKALWRFRAQLFGSNEYFKNSGSLNASYVERAYGEVLGRDADPSGKAYWTAKLDAGANRGSVALQFISSPEAKRRLVDDQFLRFLDRLPTAGEQAAWVAKIPQATGEQQLIAHLAASAEYFDRS